MDGCKSEWLRAVDFRDPEGEDQPACPSKPVLQSASGKLSLILMTVYRCYAYLRVKC
jgi:hypothetical protein